MRNVLLHEIVHGVVGLVGLLDAIPALGDGEVLVAMLTPALLGLIRDNPDLIAYLVDEP